MVLPSILKKVLNAVLTVVCIFLALVLALNLTLVIKGFVNEDKVPTILGYYPMIVLSGSMEPEIMTGDVIIGRECDVKSLQVGDTISFYEENAVVTHRILEILTTNDGTLAFVTKGDNNESLDMIAVHESEVVGKYLYPIRGLGNKILFMQTSKGILIFVVCPLLLFVGYDIIGRKKYEKKQKKETEELLKELEELKSKKQ